MVHLVGSGTLPFFERLSSVLQAHASLCDFQAGTAQSCRCLLAASSMKMRNMLLDGKDSELTAMLLSAGSEVATHFVQLIHGMEVTLSSGTQIFDLIKVAHLTEVRFIEDFCVSAIASGKYAEPTVTLAPFTEHLDKMNDLLWSFCQSEDSLFCDASILTLTTSIKMHSVMLASVSSRFCEVCLQARKRLEDPDVRPAGMALAVGEAQPADTPNEVVIEMEYDAEIVYLVREFLYNGQVVVETLEMACCLLCLAEEWQFEELRLASAEAVAREILATTLQRVSSRFFTASLSDLQQLQQRRSQQLQEQQRVPFLENAAEIQSPAADVASGDLAEPSGLPQVLGPGDVATATDADAAGMPLSKPRVPYWKGLAERFAAEPFSEQLPRNPTVEPQLVEIRPKWDFPEGEFVSVKVTHLVYGVSIAVKVHKDATILELRRTIVSTTGAGGLEDVLLLRKRDSEYLSLFDGDGLQGDTEFVTLGFNSVLFFPDDVTGSGSFSVNTLQLIEAGQAVSFTAGRVVGYGETLRVQAAGWGDAAAIGMFSIFLQSEEGDTLLHWCAIPYRQHVVRQSLLRGSWGWRAKEMLGGWPHGKGSESLTIDFERSYLKWKVSINGVRQPDFDFAHRSKADVTRVSWSQNLIDAKAFLLKGRRVRKQSAGTEIFLKPVNVIHATYRKSVRIYVSSDATVLDVRQQVLRATGSTRIEEVILVREICSGQFQRYLDDERVEARAEILALGCNSAFGIPEQRIPLQFAGANVADQATNDLLALRLAHDFKGDRLRYGDTIRVEADGWTGLNATLLNTFFVNLLNDRGDIVFHWGARYNLRIVVRNAAVKCGEAAILWCPVQETVGGWPHGTSRDPIMIDFTLTPHFWKVSVNGVRLPDFNFEHRCFTDVKEIKCSDNLINARAVFIPRAQKLRVRKGTGSPERGTQPRALPPRVVQVTHAIYGESTRVFVPSGATLLHVRETVVKEAGSARIDEVILVERVASIFYVLDDKLPVEEGHEVLALGCCSIFKATLDEQDRASDYAVSEAARTKTSELLAVGRAETFVQGQTVRDGYTIRVEADHWNGSCTSPLYCNNTFYVNLETDAGDVEFHWGARLQSKYEQSPSKCIVRNSQIAGVWSVEERVGDWPHCDAEGTAAEHVQIDFTRTFLKWNVNVNGRRVPDFDFAHRLAADVTRVTWSDNMVNTKVTLIPPAGTPEPAPEAGMGAKFSTTSAHPPMREVKVEHAVYHEHVRVFVPPSANLLAVRQQVLLASNSSDMDEVLLVRADGRGGFTLLPDDDELGDRNELLALGCSSAFLVADDSELLAKQVTAPGVDQASMSIAQLLDSKQARLLQTDDLVRLHETIRVEADGWTDSADAPSAVTNKDTFSIDLQRGFGDSVLHWGARFHLKQVIRDSQNNGVWSRVEETSGGWPHGCASDSIRIDFMRARQQWKVSVNGVRCSKFDFAHRAPGDVTSVAWSENLINARAVVISAASASPRNPPASAELTSERAME